MSSVYGWKPSVRDNKNVKEKDNCGIVLKTVKKKHKKFHSIINVSSSGAKRSKFQLFTLQKETDDHTDPISPKLLVAVTWLQPFIIP